MRSNDSTSCKPVAQSSPQASLVTDTKLSLAKWFRDRILGGKALNDICPSQPSTDVHMLSSSDCSPALPQKEEELRKSYSTDCLPSQERLQGDVSIASLTRSIDECISERPVSVCVVGSQAEAVVDAVVGSSAADRGACRFLSSEIAQDLDAMDVDEEVMSSASCVFQYSPQAEMIVQFKHADSFANPAYVDELIRPVLGQALRYSGEGADPEHDRRMLRAKLDELRSCYGAYIENCVVRLPSTCLHHDRELVYFGGLQRASSEQAVQAIRRTNCLVCTVDLARGLTHNLRGFLITSGYLQKLMRGPALHSLVVAVCPSHDHGSDVCFEEARGILCHQLQQLFEEFSPACAAANVAAVMARVRILPLDPEAFLAAGASSWDAMESMEERERATGVPTFVAALTNLTLVRSAKSVERLAEEVMNNDPQSAAPSAAAPLCGAKVEQLASSLQQRLAGLRQSLSSKNWLKFPDDADLGGERRPVGEASTAWRASLLSAVPRQIEGILAASTELFQEFLTAARETEGEGAEREVKEVRLRRLSEFCETVRQRTVMRASLMQQALLSSSAAPGPVVESSLSQVKSMEHELQHSAKLMMLALRASPQVLRGGQLAAMMTTKRQLLLQLSPATSNSWSAVVFRPREQVTSLEPIRAWSLSEAHAVEPNDPRRPLDIAAGHKLTSQQQQLREVLECVGLRAVETEQFPADESSLFRSLAFALYGTAALHAAVQHIVAAELAENRHKFDHLFGPGLSLDEYVAHRSSRPAHGDHVQLLAAAEHFGASVFVYCPRYSSPLLFRSQSAAPREAGTRALRLACFDGLHFVPVEAARLPVPTKRKRARLSEPLPGAPVAKKRLEAPETEPAAEPAPPRQKVPSLGVRMQSSLAEMCVSSVVENMDLLPSLAGTLPFELVQRLISACIAKGTLTDSVLQRLLSGSTPFQLDLARYAGGGRVLAKLLEQSGSCLETLSLKGATLRSADVLLAVASSCPRLRELDLRHCYPVDAAALALVAARCSALEVVRFANCESLHDGHVAALLQLPRLAVLRLKGCSRVTDEAFEGAGGCGLSLRELDLRGTAVSAVAVEGAVHGFAGSLRALLVAGVGMGDGVARAAAACPGLRLLCMAAASLTDEGVAAVAYGCPQLQQLRLPYCRQVTSFALQQFRLRPRAGAQPLGQLEALDLTRCLAVGDDGVLALLTLCPPLASVNLSSCEDVTDAAVVALAAHSARSLEQLNVSKCTRLSDDALLAVASSCARLQELRLYNCPGITDAAVQQLGRAGGTLRVLDASSCERVSDEGLVGMAANCPHLHTLCLEESAVTDEGLLAVFGHCRKLATVKLAYCANITDVAVARLAQLSPGLQVLDLSHSNQVSMRSIRRVLALCPQLRELNLRGYNHVSTRGIAHSALAVLNLSWCKNLEDAALAEIAAGCPSLAQLDLAWCDRVTRKGVLLLARECLSLRQLNVNGCSGLAAPADC